MSYSLTIEEVESLPSLARKITSYINFCAKIFVSPVSCRRSFAITFAKSVNSSAVSCVDDNSLICWRASLITSSASSCDLLADRLEVQGVEVSRVVTFVSVKDAHWDIAGFLAAIEVAASPTSSGSLKIYNDDKRKLYYVCNNYM